MTAYGSDGKLPWRERNLLVLLDPLEKVGREGWSFCCGPFAGSGPGSGATVRVYHRRQLARYLLDRLILGLRRGTSGVCAYLCLRDELVSVIFATATSWSYRRFRRSHISRKGGLKSRLKALLPMWLRAEARYLVCGLDPAACRDERLPGERILFFSNEAGKLLLVSPKTLASGEGTLAVTTANPDYLPVLRGEFLTMEKVDAGKGLVPRVLGTVSGESRTFFLEEYLEGTNLRELLRDPAYIADPAAVVTMLDRLDDWYAGYSAQFSGAGGSALSELYRPILDTFYRCHPEEGALVAQVRKLQQELASIPVEGLPPVVAHNDLWPGNFMVCRRGLVAIDWERAAESRCGLFDYFWMLISAYLEYHTGITGRQDYAQSFRAFLARGEAISGCVHDKLQAKLRQWGISRQHFPLFLSLFLVEWSIQGQLVLGRRTEMDRLACDQLRGYLVPEGGG